MIRSMAVTSLDALAFFAVASPASNLIVFPPFRTSNFTCFRRRKQWISRLVSRSAFHRLDRFLCFDIVLLATASQTMFDILPSILSKVLSLLLPELVDSVSVSVVEVLECGFSPVNVPFPHLLLMH